MFSPDHNTYACYLVFKFEDGHILSNDGPIFKANCDMGDNDFEVRVFANLSLTSVITIPTLKPREDIVSSKSIDGGLRMFKVYTDKRESKSKSWVEKRNDGWMETRLTNPLLIHQLENRKKLRLRLRELDGGSLSGIIVEGIEFRPVVVDGSYLVETSIKDNLTGTVN
ncbi:hypothetical protein CTI12_AA500540 [Artemisia annua]|uniref:Uncharacterized protein n=1 Tax=Artemisia annua TaxID=35608 RepID=A0A2U1LDQ2_ARTAN|nr:hypothetical protein CTI12_AA500540 [Artemisia annua]